MTDKLPDEIWLTWDAHPEEQRYHWHDSPSGIQRETQYHHHRIAEAKDAEIERLRRIINNIECEIETEMSRAEHREKIAAMDYHDSEMNHQNGRWHCAYDLSKYLQTLSQTQKESE